MYVKWGKGEKNDNFPYFPRTPKTVIDETCKDFFHPLFRSPFVSDLDIQGREIVLVVNTKFIFIYL